MSSIPALNRSEILTWLQSKGVDLSKNKMALVAFRSYDNGKNRVGVWDDRLCWIGIDGEFAAFVGNTDPSRYYTRVATLKPGVWRYKKGLHGSQAYGPYPAFRQAAPVTVLRFDGKKPAIADTGNFGINIHHGSKSGSGTSSIGCQTIKYSDWSAFRDYGYMLIKKYAVADFPYVLIDLDLEEAIANDKPVPEKKRFAPSANCFAIIKAFEESNVVKLKAYDDGGGVWTIGWGGTRHENGKPVKKGDTITAAQADSMLHWEVSEKTRGMEPLIIIDLTQNQIDALISFTYNVGLGAFKTSTLLKKLNTGDIKGAANEFPRWVKDNGKTLAGLVKRREAEKKLFLS